MTGRLGSINTRANVLEAWGNVVISGSVDGRVLKTSMIRYIQSQNLVMSDSAFVLTDRGRGMRQMASRTDPSLERGAGAAVRRGRGGAVRLPDGA